MPRIMMWEIANDGALLQSDILWESIHMNLGKSL